MSENNVTQKQLQALNQLMKRKLSKWKMCMSLQVYVLWALKQHQIGCVRHVHQHSSLLSN